MVYFPVHIFAQVFLSLIHLSTLAVTIPHFFMRVVYLDLWPVVHCSFLKYLRSFPYVFVFSEDGKGHVDQVALHSSLKSPDERTEAIGEVIKELGEGVFPGIRNEVVFMPS